VREAYTVKQLKEQTRRRAEDRIRDELRDARAKTITSGNRRHTSLTHSCKRNRCC